MLLGGLAGKAITKKKRNVAFPPRPQQESQLTCGTYFPSVITCWFHRLKSCRFFQPVLIKTRLSLQMNQQKRKIMVDSLAES